MNGPTQEELIRCAEQFYPRGFPPEEDDASEPIPAHHRTPEHQCFVAAWERALEWKEWGAFVEALPAMFPEHAVGGGTQPFVSACLRSQIYKVEPQPDGNRLVTRWAVAVSVLTPLYIVYVTTQLWYPTRRASRPTLILAPGSGDKPQADRLGQQVEHVLGCRPFPLSLAQVPLPGLRIGQLNYLSADPPPTLLDAFFMDDLANLP
ncbi:hypothetical protein [Pyxidicoccus xibeiensis]|uniref:hypothetical protein n=1 Tax=Pyxidicoccus xibeiensis TaxID=2906759 RepID=UPI0020A7DA16|nr:hypothetical protein [Pyxidicoccus xibeiensis]MCP3142248.1 hypothetical protein [Pyxidicoccus xibeiensis]